MKYRIFVAAPYTKGDVAKNVRRAIDAGQILIENGYHPFVPHLFHFWHLIHPGSYEQWTEIDLIYLTESDAMLHLLGESSGADNEVIIAGENDIPVFETVEHLNRWRQLKEK